KRVGRSHHPADSHRNQVVQAPSVGFLDEIDRVRSLLPWLPAAQIAPFHAFTQPTARRPSFFIRGQRSAQFVLHRSLLLSKVGSRKAVGFFLKNNYQSHSRGQSFLDRKAN